MAKPVTKQSQIIKYESLEDLLKPLFEATLVREYKYKTDTSEYGEFDEPDYEVLSEITFYIPVGSVKFDFDYMEIKKRFNIKSLSIQADFMEEPNYEYPYLRNNKIVIGSIVTIKFN